MRRGEMTSLSRATLAPKEKRPLGSDPVPRRWVARRQSWIWCTHNPASPAAPLWIAMRSLARGSVASTRSQTQSPRILVRSVPSRYGKVQDAPATTTRSLTSSSAPTPPIPEAARLYQRLESDVRAGQVDTVILGFTDLYGRLMGKRYDARAFVANIGQTGCSHVCNYLLTADAELNPLPGYKLASPERGYGDFSLVPDFRTCRPVTWLAPPLSRSVVILCDLRDAENAHDVPMAPRSILRRVLSRIEKEHGVVIKAASELEYYMFKDSYRTCFDKRFDPKGMTRSGWQNEDYYLLQSTRTEPYHRAMREALGKTGMVPECTKGETGVGQHELNIEYAEALTMADNHVIQKQAMKEMADARGEAVTFMAKPFDDDAGSSCHIHLSAHDAKTGKNLFAGDQEIGGLSGVSTFFGQFLAGWMLHTPEVFPLYAPTVNSYKRLVRGSWAPTTASWGWDNRTTSFRVLGSGKSLRIECRLPGADANPYLAFAAAAASGMDGVVQKMTPNAPTNGDGDATAGLVPLPRHLEEGAERLATSPLALEYFGSDTREHLAHFYRSEQRAYDRQVGEWERRRYFERI